MDLSKFTERSRGFIQAAQTIAMRESHQRLAPEHILKALLDDEEGLAANLIKRAGGAPERVVQANDLALSKIPQVTGDAGQIYMDSGTGKVLDEAEKVAKKAGDSFVPVERILMALALVRSEAKKALEAGAVNAQALNSAINDIRKGRTADTASAEDGYEALKKYSLDLTERAREGKIDPIIGRDEEIRRAMQVLSRRTKNNPVLIGDCRGPRPAHRQWRRAREPEGQAPAVARHGRADRRCEIPRRVRGTSEGGAGRGDGGRRRNHPLHRRDAHPGRRRQGRWRNGCLEPAETGAGARRAALCGRDHAG